MNGEVYNVTSHQAAMWLDLNLLPWAEASRPLLLGFWQRECVCAFGTIPVSFVGGSAYLWLWNKPKLPKIAFARHAIKTLPKLLSLYSPLICNCYNSDSAHWLKSLGAKEAGTDLYTFERQ